MYTHYDQTIIVPIGVVKLPERYFANNLTVKEIILPQTLKEIGEEAFIDCRNLVEVRIPSSVSVIGKRAFMNCIKLKELDISSCAVTTLEEGVFQHCEFLSFAGKEYLKNIKEIKENAFACCKRITRLSFSDNLSRISSGAFRESGLEELRMPESTTIENTDAFDSCLKFKHLYIKADVFNMTKRGEFFTLSKFCIPGVSYENGAPVFARVIYYDKTFEAITSSGLIRNGGKVRLHGKLYDINSEAITKYTEAKRVTESR